MENKEILKTIKELRKLNLKFGYGSILFHKYVDVYNAIFENTKFLDKYKKVTLQERIYCIEHELFDRPKCSICNKNAVRNFFSSSSNPESNHYGKWCSHSCERKDSETERKTKKTKKEKYGDEDFTNRKKAAETRRRHFNGNYAPSDFTEKIRKTKKKRYSNERYTNTKKIKETKEKRYGDGCYNNARQTKETKKERYGDEYYNNALKIKETKAAFSDEKNLTINQKREQTNLAKNRYKYYLQIPEHMEHYKEVYFEKTGFKHPFSKNSPGRIKGQQTKLEKYGDKNYQNREQIIVTTKTKFYNEHIANFEAIPLFSLEEYLNGNSKTFFLWKCKTCGEEFESRIWFGKNPLFHVRCPKCFPIKGKVISISEINLRNYVSNLYSGNIISNDRKTIYPQEIDILLPELKIGLEYDGTYWHSVEWKDPLYHLNKTNKLEEKGFKLIHILENDFIEKREVIETMLKREILRTTASSISFCSIKRDDFQKLKEKSLLEEKYSKFYFRIDDKTKPIGIGTISRIPKGKIHFKATLAEIAEEKICLNEEFLNKLSEFLKTLCILEETYLFLDKRYFSKNELLIKESKITTTNPNKHIFQNNYTVFDCGQWKIKVQD